MTPSRKIAPKRLPGATYLSRSTKRLSATMKDAATTSPREAGGGVGRSNSDSDSDSKRARIARHLRDTPGAGACPTCASEVPRAELTHAVDDQPSSSDHFCVTTQAHIDLGDAAQPESSSASHV